MCNELCDAGQKLWEDIGEMYSMGRWIIYIEHIRSCAECKKGLNIDKVIDENELLPIGD